MNRIWQEYFGRGLVGTSENFGTQGEEPSHPQLLDWLAGEFIDNGWSFKKLHKLIVMSATYRQASDTRPELLKRDPSNTLLARQSRLRLPAELIRDSALEVSGLLYGAIGGPSVQLPLPEGVQDLLFRAGQFVDFDHGEGKNLYAGACTFIFNAASLIPSCKILMPRRPVQQHVAASAPILPCSR